jgi:hypothetical protein
MIINPLQRDRTRPGRREARRRRLPCRRGRGLALARALVALAGVVVASVEATGTAQETRLLGIFGKWSAYAVEQVGRQICYVASKPTKQEGNYKKRGDVWALVSHQPQEEQLDTVQLVAGYKFKEGSEVTVTIDGKTEFTLFTDNQDAWAYDGDDQRLIEAMKRGGLMVVLGESWRGTQTKDNYSLRGFTRAYKEIGKACELQ